MFKVLVIDDSQVRVDAIKDKFLREDLSKFIKLTVCTSADQGRVEMQESYDLLILDILIPKKIGGTPQAIYSSNLLDDLCKKNHRYIRPGLIIGLTADVKEIDKHRENFFRIASVVYSAAAHEVSWLDSLVAQVRQLLHSNQNVNKISRNKVLITIHGIRTYGRWQDLINTELDKHCKSYQSIEVNYGFFDLLSFIIPRLRNKKISNVAVRVNEALKENSDKEVYVIAHSFGSMILSEAIKHNDECSIKTTIICGSPLKSDSDISHIVGRSQVTVNECGTLDSVLIAARLFVLGLGDAGRVGFDVNNSDVYMNRFHRVGHSGYFDIKNKDVTFVEQYWLPILIGDTFPLRIDKRKPYIGEDLVEFIINMVDKVKPIIYILLFSLLFYWVYSFA